MSMKSRIFKPVKIALFWNFLKLRFIHDPQLKISFCISYDNNFCYSVWSIQNLASYTKNQDDQWKLLKIAVFQTPLFTCLETTGRSFEINIRMKEFSRYCCFYQNKVFFGILNYYKVCYNPQCLKFFFVKFSDSRYQKSQYNSSGRSRTAVPSKVEHS